MIAYLKARTIKQRIAILIVLTTIGFMFFGAWSFKTLRELEVNGPLYQRIVLGKDLVADVLPPPEYIIESYLVALELANQDKREEKANTLARFNKLYEEFNTRHDYWKNQVLQADIKDLFLNYSYGSAMAFYKTAFAEFLPAVEKNDKAAISANLAKLRELYLQHRQDIENLIPLIYDKLSKDEAYANAQTGKETWIMGIILLVNLLVGSVFLWVFARSILASLGAEPQEVIKQISDIAEGKLDSEIQLAKEDTSSVLAALKNMQKQLSRSLEDIYDQIEHAVAGDFEQQLSLNGKQGFHLEITQELNQLNNSLLQKIGGNPDLAVEISKQIAMGDLSVHISTLPNDHDSILAAMLQMKSNLQSIVDEVRTVVDAAANGDFSRRMDETTHRGFSLTLAQLLNRLAVTSEKSLGDIARVATALGQGDLTQSIDTHYPGLFGVTANGVNHTRESLLNILKQIVDSVSMIHETAEQISSGNLDLSQRTEEQAASLEENAASIEYLASTVKQNAENAQLANKLVIDASKVAEKTGVAVADVVKIMDSIYESSYKVADIISVIDGLAFQTNILALNAAVEAARAGEQGRGFAVVASEVRSLAQRSAAAAKEIKELIANSVNKVETGNIQVEQAGKTMGEVVTAVNRITDLVNGIYEATTSQSQGIVEVNHSIAQMDGVTQQNAALVEEAAAAAKSLEEQADNLRKLVGVFRFNY